MERLPTELDLLLLRSASDLNSLYSLIRTSRSIYRTFQGSRASVLTSVLQNSPPTGLLREAYAVEASWDLRYCDLHVVRLTSGNMWPGLSFGTPNDYPLSDTDLFNKVARLHFAVEWLTNDLCEEYGKAQRSLDFNTLPLRHEEKVRLCRAFYRLELLCNFGLVKSMNIEWGDFRHRFLDLLPLWEVEELSCVYEYLHRKLRFTFDVRWDCLRLKDEFRSSFSRDLWISHGITFLHNTFSRSNLEDSEKSDSSKRTHLERTRIIGPTSDLRLYISQRENKHLMWPDNSVEYTKTRTEPNAGWLIVQYGHRDRTPFFEGYNKESPNRWSWGYCLWSSSRLSSRILLNKLLAYAGQTAWSRNPSTYTTTLEANVPKGWSSIIDDIDLH